MKHFNKKTIRRFFTLFCITCLFLLQSCSGMSSVSSPSNVQSAKTSEQRSVSPPPSQRAHYQNSFISITCPICGGSGICTTCQGVGTFTLPGADPTDVTPVECPTCHGSGLCWKCNGTGAVPVN